MAVGGHIDPAEVPALTAKLQSLGVTCPVIHTSSR